MPVGALPGVVIALDVSMTIFGSPVYDNKAELDDLKKRIQNRFFTLASTKKNDPNEKLFFTAMVINASSISPGLRGTAMSTQASREAASGYSAVPDAKKTRLNKGTLENYFGMIDDSTLTLHKQLDLGDAGIRIIRKNLCMSPRFDVTKDIPQIEKAIEAAL
jgi:hypothetical protein